MAAAAAARGHHKRVGGVAGGGGGAKRRKTAPSEHDGGYCFGVNVYDQGRFIRRESRGFH